MDSNSQIQGALVIFYRDSDHGREFLVVRNAGSGMTSFVGGAQEPGEPLEDTARREALEELDLTADSYGLFPTEVRHEFVFGQTKPERAGRSGSYQVFVAELGRNVSPTSELKSAEWKSKEEVMRDLSFPDLKDVFERALKVQPLSESSSKK